MSLIGVVALVGSIVNIINVFIAKEPSTRNAWLAASIWSLSALAASF